MEELNKKNDIKKIYTKGRGKREEERKGEKARRLRRCYWLDRMTARTEGLVYREMGDGRSQGQVIMAM